MYGLKLTSFFGNAASLVARPAVVVVELLPEVGDVARVAERAAGLREPQGGCGLANKYFVRM